MPNTQCIGSPTFSLSGEQFYSGTAVDLEINFADPGDVADVQAYQWYLDNNLVTNINSANFEGNVACGAHKLGARILYNNAWSGIKEILFYTCKTVITVLISGPSNLNAGQSATYAVIATFSDGTTGDLTASFTFTSGAGGSFSGNVFTAGDNPETEPASVTISAAKSGSATLTKQVTVNNPLIMNGGIIVMDFFSENIKMILAFLSTYSIANRGAAAYSGMNFSPGGTSATDSIILASDPNFENDWRFEFNVAKLMADNPLNTEFSFTIQGASDTTINIDTSYLLMNGATEITMSGSPGSYFPSTSGGAQLGPTTLFSTHLEGNAQYTYIQTLVIITYNVLNNTVSYQNQF